MNNETTPAQSLTAILAAYKACIKEGMGSPGTDSGYELHDQLDAALKLHS